MEGQTLQRRKLLSSFTHSVCNRAESLGILFQPQEEGKNGELKLIVEY